MASGAGKNSRSRRTSGAKKSVKKKTAGTGTAKRKQDDAFIRDEVKVLVVFALSVLLMLSNFGIGGTAGNAVSSVMFGLFGLFAYILPVGLFIIACFSISNRRNTVAAVKAVAGVATGFIFCAVFQMIWGENDASAKITSFYTYSAENKTGGGFFGGIICRGLTGTFGTIGAWVIIAAVFIICAVVITERSFIGGVRRGSKKVYDTAVEDARYHRQIADEKREERKKAREQRRYESEEEEKRSRLEKKVSGIDIEGTNIKKDEYTDEMREIILEEDEGLKLKDIDGMFEIKEDESDPGCQEAEDDEDAAPDLIISDISVKKTAGKQKKDVKSVSADVSDLPRTKTSGKAGSAFLKTESRGADESEKGGMEEVYVRSGNGGYEFPPVGLLKKPVHEGSGDSEASLKATAVHLQHIFDDFGVNVTVTAASRGPAVTRYEIQPEHGVKVSRIVALADDIKLNLAVADVRIEAPIPGKAAVGIEVPNEINEIVPLRELVTSDEFRKHKSKLAFGVGKDIAGKIIVADIAKMPHLLIAGATGSGKSVCINTLIMSILYKASPDEVRLIMIDPKVVELSAYNGIPHLMIPVVTDPKKAAGALNWAVAEMTKRYKLFADYNVRNLAGYNEKVKGIQNIDDPEKPSFLPQIVIIVDELADLMMVAPGEVEDAICRLAQLARAAGIHLVIATQRPSVNVITGLIKANMPSRIAFAVSSGVDSRTILDMNGAEKLLGKGDMLFYPYGYPKPVRVQGAFVSDEEVAAVVEFLKEGRGAAEYDPKIEEEINTAKPDAAVSGAKSDDRGRDALFAEAGRFIIEKDKASIGMLQRWFKVGFNRAARIMDQLADAGVVGEEAGTKPREILMTMEEFERFLEEQA